MKEQLRKVYCCEYCSKKMFVQGAMERHEAVCPKNPLNNDACNGCKYCEEVRKEISIPTYEQGHYVESGREVKSFKCIKLNERLYPHKAKNLVDKYPSTFYGERLMPVQCEYFETSLPF